MEDDYYSINAILADNHVSHSLLSGTRADGVSRNYRVPLRSTSPVSGSSKVGMNGM